MRKLRKPTEKQYEQAELNLLRGFSPKTYPCNNCAYPVLHGYCCIYCGNTNPEDRRDWD